MQTLDAAFLWKGIMKHLGSKILKNNYKILYSNFYLHVVAALLWKSITIWEAVLQKTLRYLFCTLHTVTICCSCCLWKSIRSHLRSRVVKTQYYNILYANFITRCCCVMKKHNANSKKTLITFGMHIFQLHNVDAAMWQHWLALASIFNMNNY